MFEGGLVFQFTFESSYAISGIVNSSAKQQICVLDFFFVYAVKFLEQFLVMYWPKPASDVPGRSPALLWSRIRLGMVTSRQSACIPVPVFHHLHCWRSRKLNIKDGKSYKPLGFRSVNNSSVYWCRQAYDVALQYHYNLNQ